MQEPPVLNVNFPAATLDFEMELQDADISASLGSNLLDDKDFLADFPLTGRGPLRVINRGS
jgi:hypothetical protein